MPHQQNDASLSVTVSFAIAVLIYALMPTTTMRVVEYNCPGTWDSSMTCSVRTVRSSALRFIVNDHTGDVAWYVDQNAGDWFVNGGIYKKCAVVDADNWKCGEEGREASGMTEGEYFRRSDGVGGYAIAGYTGWRYYRERVLMLLSRLFGSARATG
ncbi:hypothetical protein AWB69_00001 [Caballeronia udeis]|uniref:Uncharacterized protein n=1 Tax=Caballeronia udeis TaxID=1232866 RepID=A0A158ERC9_9BURK|nr:hypothetical protein AWB69_00001 [Caballeronia udeis]